MSIRFVGQCRFISEDPVKDGLNYYAYCGNNPVGMIDPTGLTYEPEYASSYYNRYKENSSTHHWNGRRKTSEEMSGGGSHGNDSLDNTGARINF